MQHVPKEKHYSYLKWLRFYLDFCSKYRFAPYEKSSLSHFSHHTVLSKVLKVAVKKVVSPLDLNWGNISNQ